MNDGEVTTPAFVFSQTATRKLAVSSFFANYYQSHSGQTSLGAPLTVAYPVEHGWIQFFSSGALLLPIEKQNYKSSSKDILAGLVTNGVNDPETGIVRLPLLQALLTAGSQIEIGGKGSSLTYVDIRKAAHPALLVTAASTTSSESVFVKTSTRAGKDVGHRIPQAFWQYIIRTDISPDGWKVDFGDPRTEVLPFIAKINGKLHHLQVQVFGRDGLVLDQDAQNAQGLPAIRRLSTGLDYLNTLGMPAVSIRAQQRVWASSASELLDVPERGKAVVHVGKNFPLLLQGETNWNDGMLWYRVRWDAPNRSGTGWIPANVVSFSGSSNMRSEASLDVLSSELASYVTSRGNNVGVSVYDVTRHFSYSYNSDLPFTMASSMKIPIMLAFFDMLESQGRGPDDGEMQLLTTMIENSDNDAASALYYDELGGAPALMSYLQKIHVGGLTPDPESWGYSAITPQSMVDMLTLLHQGKILNAQDRQIALDLMRHVEEDQQIGVGDTAPIGALVSLKDGWVVGPDGLWVMNSSGIVTRGKVTYVVAVYSQSQNALEDGQDIVRHVCKSIASALIV
ncbi:hypothetical protein KSX_49060 [Ktedonospora formicarum]|uniref:Beta-lactamase class A catalytic domain-containing protein n=1 Tax=Ktedonospora formicarum TaxID=2778364 RepID=A0A8J3I6H3_9CHLR|nr:hypothetical protein KSX_49060 [Ktedonospora formicarum]